MSGHERVQPKTGEYAHTVDEIIAGLDPIVIPTSPSKLPSYYYFVRKAYYVALGEGLTDTKLELLQSRPGHKESADRVAADYVLQQKGLSCLVCLLQPNPQTRFLEKLKEESGYPGALESQADIEKEIADFKSYRLQGKCVEGWSDRTKRYALWKGAAIEIGKLEVGKADFLFADKSVEDIARIARESLAANNRYIGVYRGLQRQLTERK